MLKKLGLSALSLVFLVACSSDSDDETSCDALPLAADDSAEVRRGGVVSIDVLANDSNPGCGDLRIVDVGSPNHGNVAREDSRLVYMPSGDFIGADSFTYTVANDAGEASATVTVDVFELVTLQGQVVVPELDMTRATQTVVLQYPGSHAVVGDVSEQGEFSLELPVYDLDAPGWAELRVLAAAPRDDLAGTATGNVGQASDPYAGSVWATLHALIPTRSELIDLADRDVQVGVGALPALRVTPFSSAFSALVVGQLAPELLDDINAEYGALFAQNDAEFDAAALARAAKTIDGYQLMTYARLNLALLELKSEFRLPRRYNSFLGMVGSRDNDASYQALLTNLAEDTERFEMLTDALLNGANAEGRAARMAIDTGDLQGSHIILPAQVSAMAQGSGATFAFAGDSNPAGAGDLSGTLKQVKMLQLPMVDRYLVDGADLDTTAAWGRAKHLFSAAGSSWWYTPKESHYSRLLADDVLMQSDRRFEVPGSYVLPALAGREAAMVYHFHEDGRFTTSHSVELLPEEREKPWLTNGAVLSGRWTLADNRRKLLLTLYDENDAPVVDVELRWIGKGNQGARQVVLRDVTNGALRFGLAKRVPMVSGDLAAVDLTGFKNRRLGSVYEMLAVENWRGNTLLVQPGHDITLSANGTGSVARNGMSNQFEWRVGSANGLSGVVVMTMDSASASAGRNSVATYSDDTDWLDNAPLPADSDLVDEEQRYWLPLSQDGERLWVLEWSDRVDRFGQTQRVIRPRMNVYLKPGVDALVDD